MEVQKFFPEHFLPFPFSSVAHVDVHPLPKTADIHVSDVGWTNCISFRAIYIYIYIYIVIFVFLVVYMICASGGALKHDWARVPDLSRAQIASDRVSDVHRVQICWSFFPICLSRLRWISCANPLVGWRPIQYHAINFRQNPPPWQVIWRSNRELLLRNVGNHTTIARTTSGQRVSQEVVMVWILGKVFTTDGQSPAPTDPHPGQIVVTIARLMQANIQASLLTRSTSNKARLNPCNSSQSCFP